METGTVFICEKKENLVVLEFVGIITSSLPRPSFFPRLSLSANIFYSKHRQGLFPSLKPTSCNRSLN
jgi:hypothetical protein